MNLRGGGLATNPFKNPIKTVTSGDGLYQIEHQNVTRTLNDNGFRNSEYRYVGKNPNNYVTFNEEIAGWRIIGLVNVMTTSGVVEQRIKLIRVKPIGDYSWDTSDKLENEGHGFSDWTKSDIMKLLNPGYENDANNEEQVNNSLYYNGLSGKCYNYDENQTTSCDFTSTSAQKGIVDDTSKNMIDQMRWNIGSSYTNVSLDEIYASERGNNVNAESSTWEGRVGLMYPSDYGFASQDSTCLATELGKHSKDCAENNWLYSSFRWTMTAAAENEGVLFMGNTDTPDFIWYNNGMSPSFNYSIFPVLYLKSTVSIVDGSGTDTDPYILKNNS